MPTPKEHKTVQARILHYTQEIGWNYLPREEAERLSGSAKTLADKNVRAPFFSMTYFTRRFVSSIPNTTKRLKEAQA